MPQASDRLRELMRTKFGTIDAGPPQQALEKIGYKLQANWCWEAPSVDHVVTADEEEMLNFLFQEWDFGGLVRR